MPTFDNTFARSFPADSRDDLRSRRVSGALYARTSPTAVRAPKLWAWTSALAEELGLSPNPDAALAEVYAQVFSGNQLLPGMEPIATRYGGHQFGNWAGQLGDGRAISLGEALLGGAGPGRLELQLKGAGPTAFSRRSDGRAVLRSSLREYVASEAMHALGIPTTRALSLVTTGEGVTRDMFYDGNPVEEPGAVVCRVAPSFLRLGHFEVLAYEGEQALLSQLFTYAVRTHFPGFSSALNPDAVLGFFEEVARRNVELVSSWQRVGFVHGVMNTDNFSILGLTLDYGPFGFLEAFDPRFTPNTTDAAGRRYAYGAQPRVALWNLARFAEALLAIVPNDPGVLKAAEGILASLSDYARTLESRLWCRKLGLDPLGAPNGLVREAEALLEEGPCDWTAFFATVTDWASENVSDVASDASPAGAGEQVAVFVDRLVASSYGSQDRDRAAAFLSGLSRAWRAQPEPTRVDAIRRENPRYVPRNWLLHEAIEALTAGDRAPLDELLSVLASPYEQKPGREAYEAKMPPWAKDKPGCSMLSCSS